MRWASPITSKELKTAPQSWWDIWKPEYAGKITLPSPVNAAGIPFFAHMIGLTGGTLDNPAAAVDKLKALKVSSYYDASGVAQAALQSGEAIAAAYYNTAAWAIADKGLPIAFVVPKEGAPSDDIRVHIADGTKNLDAAHAVRQLCGERRGDELPGREALRRAADQAVQDLATRPSRACPGAQMAASKTSPSPTGRPSMPSARR